MEIYDENGVVVTCRNKPVRTRATRLAIAVVGLLLGPGCTATKPVLRTDGNYMVSARVPLNGQSGAKAKALGEAQSFCRSQAKIVQLVSDTSLECALHGGCGEAEIIFSCAKPQ